MSTTTPAGDLSRVTCVLRYASLALVLGLCVACHGKTPGAGASRASAPGPATPSPPSRSPDAYGGQDRALHMQVHFWAAIDARDALIGADVEAARDSLTWLAEHQRVASMSARHEPWLAPMREAARQAASTSDASALASGIARVGQRCGECHLALEVAIDRAVDEDQGVAPMGPEYLEDRMVRHAWSVEEFWVGLVYPSESAWQRGVAILKEMPSEAPYQNREPVPVHVTEHLEVVRAMAEQASAAQDADARVEVLGKLMVSCQGCHARNGP